MRHSWDAYTVDSAWCSLASVNFRLRNTESSLTFNLCLFFVCCFFFLLSFHMIWPGRKARRLGWWSHSFPERSFILYSKLLGATSELFCVHTHTPPLRKKQQPPQKSGTQHCYEVIGVCPSLLPPPTPWLHPGSITETLDPFYGSVQKQDGMGEGEKRGDQRKKTKL